MYADRERIEQVRKGRAKQGRVFFFYSEDLFNLYIRTSPKQQGELSGFIINGHNCNGME